MTATEYKQKKMEFRKGRAEEQHAPATVDHLGIEEIPGACAISDGEIECMYCQRIIPSTSFESTCPTCATKWREEIGPQWHEQEFHTELKAMHTAFHRDRARPISTFATDDWGESLLIGLTEEDVPATVPQEVQEVSIDHREVYMVARAIYQIHKCGSKKLLKELIQINCARLDKGKEPLLIPARSTLNLWILRFKNENQPVATADFAEAA